MLTITTTTSKMNWISSMAPPTSTVNSDTIPKFTYISDFNSGSR